MVTFIFVIHQQKNEANVGDVSYDYEYDVRDALNISKKLYILLYSSVIFLSVLKGLIISS